MPETVTILAYTFPHSLAKHGFGLSGYQFVTTSTPIICAFFKFKKEPTILYKSNITLDLGNTCYCRATTAQENRDFQSSFFQTGKTRGIFPQHEKYVLQREFASNNEKILKFSKLKDILGLECDTATKL